MSELEPTDSSPPSDQGGKSSEAAPPEKRRPLVTRFGIGVILTVLWLMLVTLFAVFWWGMATLESANQAGDFFAGVFAPLAFLWIILGYLQQGDELKNSVDALNLQARELNASVKHQADIADAAQKQIGLDQDRLQREIADAVRRAQPILSLNRGSSMFTGDGRYLFQFMLKNSGATCTDLHVDFADFRSAHYATEFRNGDQQDFSIDMMPRVIEPFLITVRFTDQRGEKGGIVFTVKSTSDTNVDVIDRWGTPFVPE